MSYVCGIPRITLEGTPDDWQEIASRVEWLETVGLQRWRDVLRPVLKQFVRAAAGDVETAFWRSIYRRTPPACDFERRRAPEVTGWVIAFFPYLRGRFGGPCEAARWLRNKAPASEVLARGSAFGFSRSSPTGGVSVAPFTLEVRRGDIRPMEFLAGFLGVAQDGQTLALRPEIGWAVRQAPPHDQAT
jgi:hypothetical protein